MKENEDLEFEADGLLFTKPMWRMIQRYFGFLKEKEIIKWLKGGTK